jgi:capsular exopolysaccharide synthesis family protein
MSKNFELMQEAFREIQRNTSSDGKADEILFKAEPAESCSQAVSQEFDSVAQEECLRLVQRIFLAEPSPPDRAIIFAGIDPGTGSTRICIEVARTLAANSSGSICLVEANFRSPSMPNFFGVPNHRGLADALAGEGDMRSYSIQLQPQNLWLLSSGAVTPRSSGLLNSECFKLRLQELKKEFDHVLIDAPALNLYGDAVAMGRIADGVVVVLQADATRRESALKALETLRAANIEVLGAVLNRRTFPIPDFLYRRL